MNVAVIGAGRNRNGTGAFIARFFHKYSWTVTSVLGSTPESSRRAADTLTQYGISASSHSDFSTMVESEILDAVVIATPSVTHGAFLQKAVDAGLHIFCEKPFLWGVNGAGLKELEFLLKRAQEQDLVIAMNTQWPFVLPAYTSLCGPIERPGDHTFFMRLSPSVSGTDMIPEAVPHALSLLYDAFGPGALDYTSFTVCESGMDIMFTYCFESGVCESHIELRREKRQPRSFAFGFDGRIASRTVAMRNYVMTLTCGSATCTIDDPLELSVRDFTEAVASKREPRIGPGPIMTGTRLLNQIYHLFSERSTHGKNETEGA